MSNRVPCPNCGGRVEVPAGFARAKIRCTGCGYYAEVPPELRAAREEAPPARRAAPVEDEDDGVRYEFAEPPPVRAAPATPARRAKPQVDPRDHRPRFEPDEPGGAPLLEGTQDEDDDQPYAVPGTGLKHCPHCKGELPLDSTFCVHCGSDLAGPAKAARSFQPINRTWEEGWSLQFRMQVFIAFIVVDMLAYFLLLADGADVSWFFGVLPQVALQAFLLGSYDTFALKRNAKGQTTLTRTRRLFFYNSQPTKLRWKSSTGVGLVATHDPGLFTWFICAYMTILCIIPGILFYWFVIRPEQFQVALCDEYGSVNEVLVRSKNREQADEVATTVNEATGLRYHSVL
jgi:hypothetical protein